MPSGPRTLMELVRSARLNGPELELSDEQLIDELDFINEALIPGQPAYLEASRIGRGFALRPRERARVWALYEAVNHLLHASGLRMWSALPREICLAGQAAQRLRKHQHILVDEAQFFAPSWFQVVKLSMPADGQLFMCADPNQGFMRSRLSWKSVGLDVAGRTKKLRRSYRTTRAILQAANSVLDALGSTDTDDYLAPDFSAMAAGKPPVLVYTDSPQDAMDRVVNEVAAIAAAGRLSLNELLVIYGDNAAKVGLYNALCRRLGTDSVWWFNEKNQKRQPPQGYGPDYLRMAYLDTATGLEARVVFLLGIEALWFTGERPGLSEEAQAQRREDNARRLYMAMTRAKQRLVLVSARQLEPSMERLFECVP
jgi:superfamily I DNA/RNA helicase